MIELLFFAFSLALAVMASRYSLIKFEEYYLDPEREVRAFVIATLAQIIAIFIGGLVLVSAGLEVGRAIFG